MQNAQQLYDAKIGTLPGAYSRMDARLDSLSIGGKVGKVFLTQYLDISHKDDGSFCDGLTPRERADNTDPDGVTAEGLSQSEYAFASQTVVAGLNNGVAAGVTAANTNGGPQWNLIDNIAPLWGTHGYCANDRWVRTIFESFSSTSVQRASTSLVTSSASMELT